MTLTLSNRPAPATTGRNPRTLHVERCMGTVFTIDIRDPGGWDAAILTVVTFLHQVDAVFSTYRKDSAISRIRRGQLAVADADPRVGEVLDLCNAIEIETAGYFSAQWRAAVDPTGLVKGWAVERASQLLRGWGSANHAVNGGGDVQLAGESAPGQPWTVGISDPAHRTRLLTAVCGRDFAIATSGTAERGAHLINPHTRQPSTELRAMTVTGPELTRVDAYATAAFVMGLDGLSWIDQHAGYHALAITANGRARWTTGFPSLVPNHGHPPNL